MTQLNTIEARLKKAVRKHLDTQTAATDVKGAVDFIESLLAKYDIAPSPKIQKVHGQTRIVITGYITDDRESKYTLYFYPGDEKAKDMSVEVGELNGAIAAALGASNFYTSDEGVYKPKELAKYADKLKQSSVLLQKALRSFSIKDSYVVENLRSMAGFLADVAKAWQKG